jgi:hypothetical protein
MERQELQQLIEGHLSIRRTAKAAGVSYTTIRYWLKFWGLKSKGKSRGLKPCYPLPECMNCGNPVRRRPNIYCSSSCQWQFKRQKRIENSSGNVGVRLLKSYLLDQRGSRCEVCGITEWMGKPAPLELDHKDGNSSNNDFDNLRLICPNCHAQTETYKGKNTGRGRHFRRPRYASSKSY